MTEYSLHGRIRGCLSTVVLMAVVACGGCGRAWRPSMETVQPVQPSTTFDLAKYWPDEPGWRWTYQRRDVAASENSPPQAYVRCLADDCWVEGALLGRKFLPLERYLQRSESPGGADNLTPPGPTDPTGRQAERPQPPLSGGAAFFLEFDPPLAPFPSSIGPDQTVVTEVAVRYYDRNGRLRFRGTVQRQVELEGLETIAVPAGRFADCLRLRAEMRFRFPWGPRVDTTEYIWLARGVGAVRQIEHFEGLALFWIVSETVSHELATYVKPEVPPAYASGLQPARRWWRAAVLFERWFPRPMVGGIHHQLARIAGPVAEYRTLRQPEAF